MNRLKQLEQLGQSVWLDFISRDLIKKDGIRKLVEDDGIGGMTSNPSIFQKSLSQGTDYDADIKKYVDAGMDVGEIFRKLSIDDIKHAADALKPVYDRTGGADGFISIEVSPYISADTQGSIAEAKSLWAEIAKPNLMVKVPGTKEGAPAIRELIGEGININVTLLFALDAYQAVIDAYIDGLEKRPTGDDLSKISSVASFFLSRIDTMADDLIDEKLKDEPGKASELLAPLRGKVAIASAKVAYQMYKKAFSGARWEKLAARGARPQRLLWASTGTKNKDYPDTLYVDSLIGPMTVNTMPPETMDAFRDHGTPKAMLEDDAAGAERVLKDLKSGGISLDAITDALVKDGVAKFEEAADKLYGSLAQKRAKLLGTTLATVAIAPGEAQKAIDAEIKARNEDGAVRRIWAKDKTLWTNDDEDKWLGWLDVVDRELRDNALPEFAAQIEKQNLSDVVLLGMGGSSLGSEVLRETFGHREGWPTLHVLDSTDPDQIRAVEKQIKIEKTAFIVCSKSGSTLEPNILFDFFHDAAMKAGGGGKQFIAITDPASSLEKTAKEKGFSHVFYGEPAIGGRYSVLSKFGLVPAAAMGLDVKRLLTETHKIMTSCGPLVPADVNPGVKLGIALGVLAKQFHRDKVTILTSKSLSSVGTWLEQLIAESTGKLGKGLIPIDREEPGDPDVYGNDRVFVHLRLAGGSDPTPLLTSLEQRGHPVIRITIEDSYQLGQIFYLWEIAIAMVGAVIGINPFNQPDVEAAKIKARALTDAFEKSGTLDIAKPDYADDHVAVYAPHGVTGKSLTEILKNHLATIKDGDYFAFLAFITQNAAHEQALEKLRRCIRDAKKVATCLEFGPRFLHSTGQAYKGGPDTGVFLTLTSDRTQKLAIPGRKIDFGTVQLAQAIGDVSVLDERKRRVMRVNFKNMEDGLKTLGDAIEAALR
jgi:transaldolase/glucose-6-phosphate isomerase